MTNVTYDLLARAGACKQGLDDFADVFGRDAVVRLRGTQFEQGLILAHPQLRRWWGWAVARRILPAWSMAELNLSGADLSGASLHGADLRGANLYGADLYGADLSGADLRGADLYWADLRGADLYGADLRGANLYGADLRRARFNIFTEWSAGFDPQAPGRMRNDDAGRIIAGWCAPKMTVHIGAICSDGG